jgi:hypothetical protein
MANESYDVFGTDAGNIIYYLNVSVARTSAMPPDVLFSGSIFIIKIES